MNKKDTVQMFGFQFTSTEKSYSFVVQGETLLAVWLEQALYRDDLIIEAYDNRSSLIREADLIFWRSFYYERLSD